VSGHEPARELDQRFEDLALPPRSRHRFSRRVAALADGTVLAIPILVVTGQSPRPRLVCVAGVHGDEHEGVTAQLELWEELAPDAITGTLVLVPVANPPAFRAGMRRNPEDPVDMNRIFPGDPSGSVTQRLAYHLFHDVVAGADLVLSMHGWSSEALVVPYVEYPRESPVTQASLAAAQAFGLEYVEAWDWPVGMLVATCTRAGIPAIEPEIGGLGCTTPEGRALYKRGVRNLMRHLGMLDGEPERPATTRRVTRCALRAPSGGLVRRHVELGGAVRAGDRVATVTDVTGIPLASVASPIDGFVAAVRMTASTNPGDTLAVIFQPIETL
jgi:predicted deacylase